MVRPNLGKLQTRNLAFRNQRYRIGCEFAIYQSNIGFASYVLGYI